MTHATFLRKEEGGTLYTLRIIRGRLAQGGAILQPSCGRRLSANCIDSIKITQWNQLFEVPTHHISDSRNRTSQHYFEGPYIVSGPAGLRNDISYLFPKTAYILNNYPC